MRFTHPIHAFLGLAARLLHRHGMPVHSLEERLLTAAAALGVSLQVCATPTAVELAFGGGGRQRSYMIRGEGGDAELGRLVAVDRVIGAVIEGRLDPSAGRRRLRELAEAPALYGAWATAAAFALSSAAAARFFAGSWIEIAASGLLGLLLGVLAIAAGRRPELGRVFAPLAVLLVALLAQLLTAKVAGIRVHVTTMAAVIVLLPGLSLTVAMTELAMRHLVSGTSRLIGALSVLVTMAFGVGAARTLVTTLEPEPWLELSSSWTLAAAEPSRLLALVLAPVGFAVLFQARRVDMPAVVVTGVVAAELARISGVAFGPELGAFFGAAVVGLAAELYGRWRRVPEAVLLLPGLLLLVPGSLGFQSVSLFLAEDPAAGIAAGFHMVLVAVALVAGVLVGKLAAQLAATQRATQLSS